MKGNLLLEKFRNLVDLEEIKSWQAPALASWQQTRVNCIYVKL
jgi:hypothetical protein